MLRSLVSSVVRFFFFFFQAEDGIRDPLVTGVQTCALPISPLWAWSPPQRRGRHALRRFADAHSSPGCFLLRLARTAFWQLVNCRTDRQLLVLDIRLSCVSTNVRVGCPCKSSGLGAAGSAYPNGPCRRLYWRVRRRDIAGSAFGRPPLDFAIARTARLQNPKSRCSAQTAL